MEPGTGEDLDNEIRRGSGELLHQHEECHSETEETETEVPHVDQEEEGLAGWSSWSVDSARADLFQGEEWKLYERMRTENRTEIDRIRSENVQRAERARDGAFAEKSLPPAKRRKLAAEKKELGISIEEYYEDWIARNSNSWRAIPSHYPGRGGH